MTYLFGILLPSLAWTGSKDFVFDLLSSTKWFQCIDLIICEKNDIYLLAASTRWSMNNNMKSSFIFYWKFK